MLKIPRKMVLESESALKRPALVDVNVLHNNGNLTEWHFRSLILFWRLRGGHDLKSSFLKEVDKSSAKCVSEGKACTGNLTGSVLLSFT